MVKTALDLMAELAQAINDYLADSPQIREKVAEIKTAGFDVVITFEATVTLRPDDDTRGTEGWVH
jgi:hypothetical protein